MTCLLVGEKGSSGSDEEKLRISNGERKRGRGTTVKWNVQKAKIVWN